jgi:hypothetical protein
MSASVFIRRAASACIGLVVAVVALEVLIRVTGKRVEPSFGTILALTRTEQDYTQRHGAPPIFGLWAPDDTLGWRFRANAAVDLSGIAYYENKAARTNRFGMLDADPDSQKKLVFVMGDSLVEGLAVTDERHFCRRLERAFPSFDFLNLGVSGYGSVQSYLHLKQRMAPSRAEQLTQNSTNVFATWARVAGRNLLLELRGGYNGWAVPLVIRNGLLKSQRCTRTVRLSAFDSR